jgi:CheY-like chemotaxis protein
MARELAGKTVLLVASNAVTRELVKVYLVAGGANVVEAADAAAALGAAQGQIDLALVDVATRALDPQVLMPVLTRAGAPAIVLAGAREQKAADAWRAAGAVSVVAKPVAPERLLSAAAAALKP